MGVQEEGMGVEEEFVIELSGKIWHIGVTSKDNTSTKDGRLLFVPSAFLMHPINVKLSFMPL